MKNIKKIVLMCLAMIFTGTFLSGCGEDRSAGFATGQYYYPAQDTETVLEEEQEVAIPAVESSIGTDLYLIISNDMTLENMVLEQIASGKQYLYYYSLTTSFKNKYGDHTTVSDFEPGRVVNIGTKDSEGKLREVQISDEVWEYSDITRYSIDEDRGVFKIADTNYSFDKDIFVVSDGIKTRLSSLTELDEIRVTGIDKKILAVSITTGHGSLQLKNTKIFEGSYIQIGKRIFAEVTADMEMEIPEGTYTVAVANNGYGGTTDITIERDRSIVIDLDELKGEGPKEGQILFAVDVEGATLKIDGETKDYSKAIPLQYGIHSITVSASGYDDYSKKLFVNSEEATILIELTDGEDVTTTTAEESAETSESGEIAGTTSEQAGSLSGSLAGSTAGSGGTTANSGTTNSGTSSSGTTDTSADYLSTLSELLSTLTGQNSNLLQ